MFPARILKLFDLILNLCEILQQKTCFHFPPFSPCLVAITTIETNTVNLEEK
jgi:hypothetical protein